MRGDVESGDGQGGRAATVRRARVGRLALTLLGAVVVSAGLAAPAGASNRNESARAKHMLLVHSDFPSGWKSSGSVTTSQGGGNNSFPGETQLAGCLGVSRAILNFNAPSATSPTFQNEAGSAYAQNTVAILPSTRFARREYAALSSAKVPSCMTTALQGPAGRQLARSLGKGLKAGTMTVSAARPSLLVRHASGFVIAFPVTTKGVTVNTAISIVYMQRGRNGTQLFFSSVGLPFPASLARHLEAKVYRRI